MDYDVVIIGAGAAGIAASRRIAGSGLSGLLLEASDRVGGRAWTQRVGGLALDLGCGWLHSADRNVWTGIAEASGFVVDRRLPVWRKQYHDLGFSRQEQAGADAAYAAWTARLPAVAPRSDRAADALDAGCEWNAYLQGLSSYIDGAELEQVSIADHLAYDAASTDANWRVVEGYGALVAASLPATFPLRLSTPAEAIILERSGVAISTRAGTIRASAAILSVSSAVLSRGLIRLPADLDPWRRAAECLPLGRNEKLFLEIIGDGPFAPETHVIGDPRRRDSGAFYIRPFGAPVIEGFYGGEGARMVEAEGPASAFQHAIDQLAALFGEEVRRCLRPLVSSTWSRTDTIGGSYSHALPGHAAERERLAQPFEDRLFFAGEASHPSDFSTAHGAYQTGDRAADEVIAVRRG